MDLKAYFKQTKRQDREAFAKALGVHHDYLYRCSRGTRKPGSELCKEIVKLDSRFTLAELRPDIWGNGLDGVAASDDTQPPVGSSGRTSKRKNGGSNGRKTKEQRLPSRV